MILTTRILPSEDCEITLKYYNDGRLLGFVALINVVKIKELTRKCDN